MMTNINFAKQLGNPDIKAKYLIGKDKTCCYSDSNDKYADAYLLYNSKQDAKLNEEIYKK